MIDYEQLSLFDDILTEYKITKPVRLISFFSGIEAQYKALKWLGDYLRIPVESYKTCEWAYNSIIACNSIHNRDFTDYSEGKTKEEMLNRIHGISVDYNQPLSDEQLERKPLNWIKKAYNACIANHNLINIMNVHASDLEIIDNNEYEYIVTYSYPCQDLSLAGKRAGMAVSQAKGGTRSGLLWEVERILLECEQLGTMPNVLIMENVPQIHSEKDMPNFRKWIIALENMGYNNYFTDLNASDFGIPQNRERCFMVSVLGREFNYKFPIPFEREKSLSDFLESNVDEKYYLSQKMLDYLTGKNQKESKYNRREVFERNLDPNKDVAATITTCSGQRPTDNFVITWDDDSDFIPIINNTKKGYLEGEVGDGVNIGSRMHHQRGNVQKGMIQTLKTSLEIGVIVKNDGTIKINNEEGTKKKLWIRKLSSKECLRLMAFQDKDCEHMKEVGLVDANLVHVAGDSIPVNLLLGIFCKLFGKTNEETKEIIKDYIKGIKDE